MLKTVASRNKINNNLLMPSGNKAQTAKTQSERARLSVRFGERVTQLRELHGWKQSQLAEKSGLQKSTIARIERGETFPQEASAKALAEALGTSWTSFLIEQNEKDNLTAGSVIPYLHRIANSDHSVEIEQDLIAYRVERDNALIGWLQGDILLVDPKGRCLNDDLVLIGEEKNPAITRLHSLQMEGPTQHFFYEWLEPRRPISHKLVGVVVRLVRDRSMLRQQKAVFVGPFNGF